MGVWLKTSYESLSIHGMLFGNLSSQELICWKLRLRSFQQLANCGVSCYLLHSISSGSSVSAAWRTRPWRMWYTQPGLGTSFEAQLDDFVV